MSVSEDMNQELLSPNQVAGIMNIHPHTVAEYARKGIIRGFVINPGSKRQHWRIYADSVRERMGIDKPESVGTG